MNYTSITTYIILLTILISFFSCERVFDSTDEIIYYNSFENESDLINWEGLSVENLQDDAAAHGSTKSVYVSGGCPIPTVKYTLKSVGVEQRVSISCYGKNLTNGGVVYISLEDEFNMDISIQIENKSWTFYECDASLIWPADKDLSICFFSGGFVSSSMLIDELRIRKIN